MKKNLAFYLIAAISLTLFSLLQLIDPQYFQEKLESKTYDLRLNLRNSLRKPDPAPDIAIVMVDEKSISEIGRWPWSRAVMADLVNKVSTGKPRVIGIDIMFTERENREIDDKLATALKNAVNVVFQGGESVQKAHQKVLGLVVVDYSHFF